MSRANEQVEKIVSSQSFDELPAVKRSELFRIIQADAKKYGFDQELKKRLRDL